MFIHGAGGDGGSWKQEQKMAFEAGYNSIAIDLRGHGLSDDPIEAEAYAFERLAQDMVELVEKLRLERVVVVGHCFGGMVAMVLAGQRHSFIKGLVLVDTSYLPSFFGLSSSLTPRLANTLRQLAYAFPPGTQSVRPSYEKFANTGDLDLKRLISDVRATSLRSYLLCYGEMFELDATGLLDKINVPTLVICGDKDIIFPPEVSRNLAGRIRGANLAIIPEANHILVIAKPTNLMKVVLDFTYKLYPKPKTRMIPERQRA